MSCLAVPIGLASLGVVPAKFENICLEIIVHQTRTERKFHYFLKEFVVAKITRRIWQLIAT